MTNTERQREHAQECQARTARAFESIKRNGHHPAKPIPRAYAFRHAFAFAKGKK